MIRSRARSSRFVRAVRRIRSESRRVYQTSMARSLERYAMNSRYDPTTVATTPSAWARV